MNVKCATNGISAKQEALWSTEDLGTFEIEHTRYDGSVTPFVQVIFEESGRWITADTVVLRTNAADADRVNKGIFTVAGNPGCKGHEVFDVVEIDVLDEVSGKSRNRKGYILNILLALGRGNDNHLKLRFLGKRWA